MPRLHALVCGLFGAGLAACAQSPGALPDPALGWQIEEIDVSVAHDAPLAWCETRYGCANVAGRVTKTVTDGLDAAVAGMAGSRAVRLEAEVERFQGLTMAEAFTSGGRYDVAISLRARDLASGADLAPPLDITLDHYGFGGLLLLIAEGGQRERLAAEIARDVRLWMAEAGRVAARRAGPAVGSVILPQALDRQQHLPGSGVPDPELPPPPGALAVSRE